MKKKSGFTLIELMIVVAIIAIIAAIALPNLLRSRLQSNESAAIGNIRTINTAQITFNSANNAYAESFEDLTDATPPFLDGDWTGAKNGYNFTLGGTTACFDVTAAPEEEGVTGNRTFFSDCSGVIRLDDADGDPIGETAGGGGEEG